MMFSNMISAINKLLFILRDFGGFEWETHYETPKWNNAENNLHSGYDEAYGEFWSYGGALLD